MSKEINVIGTPGKPPQGSSKMWYFLLLLIPIGFVLYLFLAGDKGSEKNNISKVAETSSKVDSAKQTSDIIDTSTSIATNKTPENSNKDEMTSEGKSSKEAGKSNAKTYRVNSGDCLWTIAEKSELYGNPYQWMKIFEANKDKIKDPSIILINSELIIP